MIPDAPAAPAGLRRLASGGENAEMDCIAGFAWPVPRAFAGAVSACRFEQGDVLYADRAAYQAWDPAPGFDAIVQVLDPPRTARAPSGDAEGSRFRASWASPVTLDLHRPGVRTSERRTTATTQGRLFTCLWHGDPACLGDTTPVPEPPALLRQLQRRVAEAVPVLRTRLDARAAAGGHSLFVMAVDDASDASRIKAHAIEALLEEAFDVERCMLAPEEAGLSEDPGWHPALGVTGIAIRTRDEAAIAARLAGLLYAGSDETGGRFSLARHGHLEALSEGEE